MQRIKFYLLILLFVSFMKIGIIEVHAISCPVSYTNLGGGVFEYEVIYDSDKRQFSIFPEIIDVFIDSAQKYEIITFCNIDNFKDLMALKFSNFDIQ